jgi:hypothetical protein
MSLLGLDLNASRARAVFGPQGDFPLPTSLEADAAELPMILSMEKSTLQVGRAGLRLVREAPHLACAHFLPHLGEQGPLARTWRANRHRLDADHAFAAFVQHIRPVTKKAKGVVSVIPSYFTRHQIHVLRQHFVKSKVTYLGSLSAALAAALVGYAEQQWAHAAIVVDVDDHAMTLGWIKATDGNAYLIDQRHLLHLGLRAWKERLINALADCCVRQTRLDPRDNPVADQRLYEQLDSLMEGVSQGRIVQLGVQAQSWYQNLIIYPEQAQAYCTTLLRHFHHELDRMLADLPPEDMPVFLLTHAASRLPGVAALLQSRIEERVETPTAAAAPVRKTRLAPVEDFGLDLFKVGQQSTATVVLLSPDALGRAAHLIGSHLLYDQTGEHLDAAAPLPLPQPFEFGPARLQFQGQDYFLIDSHVSLGSQPSCQLHFDAHRHPKVGPRHCEIHYDHRNYILYNRSHDGTLVNDTRIDSSTILQAGDWIRLGDKGPALRFLGQGRMSG